MGELVQAVRPHLGVVTRIGHAYTDQFQSLDQYAAECRLLVEYLGPTGMAAINYDDDRVREMAARCRAKITTFGIDSFGADLLAYNVVVGTTRTGFDLRHGSHRHVGRWTPLLGKHQLMAVLSALAVGLHYDIPLAEALKSLPNLQALPGRMNPLNGTKGARLVDDSFSADPESTMLALEWLKAVTEENHRAIFVFGDMDNLGVLNQRGHRLVGQQSSEFVDLLITQGTDAAMTGRAALDQGVERKNVHITYSLQDTIGRLTEVETLTPDDVILVKGGVGARMELVTRALMENPTETTMLPRRQMLDDLAALTRPLRPTWVEVDLNALAANVRGLRTLIGDGVTLFAVVKADGYGHGAVAAARTAMLNGAGYLAVANIQEALDLRDAGIEAPILIMGYVPIQLIRHAVRQNVTVTLYDLDLARAYDRAAREANGILKAHVEIDTGMGRMGVPAREAVPFFRHMVTLKHLNIEGIYTHFSTADEDPAWMNEQLKVFQGVLTPLRAGGFALKYIHAANSAATLAAKETHFNAVRVGLAMYGLSPSDKVRVPGSFKPVLTWKTVIAQVKTLPPNHPVGYGNSYRTQTEERIAVLPVGYADGFRRAPQSWGQVLVHGRTAPIIGRISMEKIVISINHIPDVAIGDEVVLLGQQGEESITADEIAARLGTISYEVVTGILPRIPRR
jgi:alanine racemase